MKKNIIIIGLLSILTVGLITLSTQQAPAHGGQNQTPSEVIIFQSTHNSNPAYPIGHFPYQVSGSHGAPKIVAFPDPNAISSAQVIANCLNLGYEITFINQTSVILVKPAGR